jgi:hypothetical protein
MPELARRFQAKLDREFPHGVITGANSTDHGRTTTLVSPRPEVVAMRGLNPVVFLDFPVYDRNLSGTIIAWEPVRETPFRVVRVTMDLGGRDKLPDEVSLWSGNISEANAAAMEAERKESLLRSEKGEVWHGRRWFGEDEP